MSKSGGKNIVARNKRARFDFLINDVYEAGIVLEGSEVKSLRQGKGSISESYAAEEDGELFLINSFIPEYIEANQFNHFPRRRRKLLLHSKELNKILGAIRRKGMTLVPISIFFNKKGFAKVEIGLGVGKKKVDKRETEKTRDWQRGKARILRNKG